MKGRLQSAPAHPEQSKRDAHVVTVPRKLTEREAAEHCRYYDRGCAYPVRAFQKWARRAGVPVQVVARARLYDPRVLDAFLNREPWTRRHGSDRKAGARQLVAVLRHDLRSVNGSGARRVGGA